MEHKVHKLRVFHCILEAFKNLSGKYFLWQPESATLLQKAAYVDYTMNVFLWIFHSSFLKRLIHVFPGDK